MLKLDSADKSLKLGDKVLRRELHAGLGGQVNSKISPSVKAPVVLLFVDPSSGTHHRRLDGWHDDGLLHYSGEGSSGDQEMRRGNKALREHEALGRELHAFHTDSTASYALRTATYMGQFTYVDHYEVDAPEPGTGIPRKVIVFRLKPLEAKPANPNPAKPAETTVVAPAPFSRHFTDEAALDPDREPTEAARRKLTLVLQYRAHLEARGTAAVRHRIQPAGEVDPIHADLFDLERNLLVAAIGNATRDAVRGAIGQLHDLARFFSPRPQLAVLAPSMLRADLHALLREYDIGVIERSDEGFCERLVGHPQQMAA